MKLRRDRRHELTLRRSPAEGRRLTHSAAQAPPRPRPQRSIPGVEDRYSYVAARRPTRESLALRGAIPHAARENSVPYPRARVGEQSDDQSCSVAAVLPEAGGRRSRVLAARQDLRGQRRRSRRRRKRRERVRLLRRPAVRQRPAALRPPADRLRQGRRAALPDDARPPGRAPLRLGLPRAPRRVRGREAARHLAQERDRGDGRRAVQRRLPRLRAALHRRLARATSLGRRAGWTSSTTTRRSTCPTWKASCGRSRRSGTRA